MDSVIVIKFISALLYPLGLVFIAACLALVCRIRGRMAAAKRLSIIAAGVLLLSSNSIVASWLVFSLEAKHPQLSIESIAKHDLIIVLGGGLRIPTAPAKHVQLTHGSDRYWYAARLFREGKGDRILLSGGNLYQQPGVQSEAYYAAELLHQWGVPRGSIEVELGSRTTAENYKNTAELISDSKIKSALLVTSAIHMPRAYRLFEGLPIKITPASADVIIRQTNSAAVLKLIPSAFALKLATLALHEYYGLGFSALKRWYQKVWVPN
ncbi:MAG: uncharacterized SAM-binding protein YcdF (DUF218 family) [Arenicella sp.]|jgi:uncharacterized SAM-binding protein YcdF (DUF218 family)